MAATKTAKQSPRMSDAAVKAKTGKAWSEWFKVLDAAGAKQLTHQEIVALLHEKHAVGPWWQQMVTVTYEQARGLREQHQKPGGYQISVSRTIDVPVSKAFKAWVENNTRGRWLKDPITIRKATANKSLRIAWSDGKTSVEVNFYPKGAGKCQVVAQHSKLADAKAAARMKVFWARALAGLKRMIE